MKRLIKTLNKYNGNVCFVGGTESFDYVFVCDREARTITQAQSTQWVSSLCVLSSAEYLVSFSTSWLGRLLNGTLNEGFVNTTINSIDQVISSSEGLFYALDRKLGILYKFSLYPFTIQWQLSVNPNLNGEILIRESDNAVIYYDNQYLSVILDANTYAEVIDRMEIENNSMVTISPEHKPEYSFLRWRQVTGSNIEQSSSSSSYSSSSSSLSSLSSSSSSSISSSSSSYIVNWSSSSSSSSVSSSSSSSSSSFSSSSSSSSSSESSSSSSSSSVSSSSSSSSLSSESSSSSSTEIRSSSSSSSSSEDLLYVSGELNPAANGEYQLSGTIFGKPYYTRLDSAYFIQYTYAGFCYEISDTYGGPNTYSWKNWAGRGNPIGDYTPVNPSTGIATVSQTPIGEYSSSSSSSLSSESSSSSSSMSSESSSSSSSISSESSSSSSSSFDCPNNIISITTTIRNDIVFTSDANLSCRINGGLEQNNYITLFNGDTTGQSYDENRIFWGETNSTTTVSNGFICIIINATPYYIEIFTGDNVASCRTNIIGNFETVGTFSNVGFALISVNNTGLRYIPIYTKT